MRQDMEKAFDNMQAEVAGLMDTLQALHATTVYVEPCDVLGVSSQVDAPMPPVRTPENFTDMVAQRLSDHTNSITRAKLQAEEIRNVFA